MHNNISINKLKLQLLSNWKTILTSIVIIILAIFTLSLQINTLINGQNSLETSSLNQLLTEPKPTERMVNAPYNIPAYYLGQLFDDALYGARVTSVLYTLLSTIVLYFLVKRWFTKQIAIIASLLFITSSWVLVISHIGAPLILLVLAPFLLVASLARYVANKESSYFSFLLLIMSLAFSAYVPYMFWTILSILIVIIFVYKKSFVPYNIKGIILACLLYIVLLAPLAVSLTNYPGQIKELLGIPAQLPTISEYLYNFSQQFISLFIVIKPFPELFLANLPILDLFSSAMVIIGVYYFIKYAPKQRRISFFIALCILLLIIPLSNNIYFAMTALIPFIYILIASGIFEMLKQWYDIFPRNPFARNIAVIAIVLVIGVATYYNLERFYVAWPNTEATNAVYMVQSK